jgi:hypothetical protein
MSAPDIRYPASSPGLTHERPARFVCEEAHGIDSIRFQVVAGSHRLENA